jgi:HAE1 family hydrophobic/amphiphilic exporter-1
LANAGVNYVILKDWSVRGRAKGQDLRSILEHIQGQLNTLPDGRGFVLVPPPIQGIGNAGGFTMQIELRDGSFDYEKLLNITQAAVERGSSQSGLQHLITSFRADVPQLRLVIDRSKAETLKVSVGDVFSALSSYLGSTYVNQFNKFGLSFQVYVQAARRWD